MKKITITREEYDTRKNVYNGNSFIGFCDYREINCLKVIGVETDYNNLMYKILDYEPLEGELSLVGAMELKDAGGIDLIAILTCEEEFNKDLICSAIEIGLFNEFDFSEYIEIEEY